MNKKLTLSVDSSVIDRAKLYARQHEESLSQLVENYFRFISMDVKEEPPKYAPEVMELLGSVSVPENINIDDLKASYLEEKLLND